MEAKIHRWVQRHGWDRAVEHYEAHWCDQLRPAHDALLEVAALQPGERVIDIACGTGRVALAAAERVGPTGRVLATDLAAHMVDDTAKRAGERGLDNVTVRRCGAEDLGEVGEHDVALCALGLMYVPDPAAALAEAARVLRPGGRAVFAVWGQRRHCGWAGVFEIVSARVASDVCPHFFALGAPGALADLLARRGFEIDAEERISTTLRYDDAESALGAAFLGGPVALAHSRFDEATKASAHAEYLAAIEPYRHGTGYRIPGELVVVAARAPEIPTSRQPTPSVRSTP